MNLGVKEMWATPFYTRVWDGHPAEEAGIADHLYAARAADAARGAVIASGVAPAMKAARGLYESGFDLFQSPHPGLRRLVAFLDETLRAAVSHVNGSHHPPDQLVVTFVDSWCHITGDRGFHDAHYHTGCSWCGIYYLRLGASGPAAAGAPNGGSRFYSPFPAGGTYRDYGNAFLGGATLDPPLKDGLVILFPSYLLHSGLPYRGDADRVVIAFNAQVHLRA